MGVYVRASSLCTPGFHTQPRKKWNILKLFFIHMQTDAAQLPPRCKFTWNSPSSTANQHNFPAPYEQKRCTKAQREAAQTNPLFLASRVWWSLCRNKICLVEDDMTAFHTSLRQKKIKYNTPQALHLKVTEVQTDTSTNLCFCWKPPIKKLLSSLGSQFLWMTSSGNSQPSFWSKNLPNVSAAEAEQDSSVVYSN